MLGKAVIADAHPNCLGGIGMLGTTPSVEAMEKADTLLMIGTSFPYIEYLPKPGQVRGIQIDIMPKRIGLRYPVEVGLVGDSNRILWALEPLLKEKGTKSMSSKFLQSMQISMKRWNELLVLQSKAEKNKKPIKSQTIASEVSKRLDDNCIVSVDSGTNTIYAARYINIRKGMKFSLSGTLASMACGLPYAIAAKIAFPERQSIAFVGDGGFTMLMGEFATAVQYELPIKVIILKNNTLGMIRWEQLAFLGNPEYGVEFSPINFAEFAEACGGMGYTIKNNQEIEKVMEMAMSKDETKPAIIQVEVNPFEPPMPPKAEPEFLKNIAESFSKGQPYKNRIDITMFRKQINNQKV